MSYDALRNELQNFYFHEADKRAEEFCVHCLPLMDAQYQDGMSSYAMKEIQYGVIATACDPVLFANDPFYYEIGTIPAICDGARNFRGGTRHAGGWTYWKNQHLFADQDPALWDLRCRQGGEQLYLICGPYCDTSQHFNLNYAPILQGGLVSLYEKAKAQLDGANEIETAYLHATMTGLLAVRQISEKFALAAQKKLKTAVDATERAYLTRIADAAMHCPWQAPRTFYEALNTLAFLRKVLGALEGVGFNTFGRPDVSLLPFYEADLASGRLTKDEAKDLIARFLLSFDCCYDHDMKMVGYADHEMENTYTIGGCDAQGEPVWNDLTELFLTVTREEKILYPKIKCRFSDRSPKAYFDAINDDVIHSTSSILYQNDNACIPALERYGRTPEEARDYVVTGCWGMMAQGCEKPDNGSYVNLLKPFEFSIHRRFDKNESVGIDFAPIDDAQDFAEVYQITLDNFRKLFYARWDIVRRGKGVWSQVDPLPLYSAPLGSCLDKRTDYTAGGAKYQDDQYMLVGFPNVVDSLLVIRTLCYEEKLCTLTELLTAVRANWEGYDVLRAAALHKCPFWGDGTETTGAFARKLNDDLYALAEELPPTLWGGRTQIGHLTYTEIRFWAEKTLATPDGRKNGEYFSQGLTPSRLHAIDSATQVVESLACLDGSKMAANSVINVLLPSVASGGMTLDLCESFLRACAGSALQCLQLNCVSREELLDAQKHPENHRDLILRVCGFSARFTSLSPEWQAEVLSRNFYNG